MKFSVFIISDTYFISYDLISKTEVKTCVLDGQISSIVQPMSIQTLLSGKNKRLMYL